MAEEQPQDDEERLEEGDSVKFKPFGHPVTINEIHAVELGLVGLIVGMAYAAGFEIEALGATTLLIGLALGIKRIPDEQDDEDEGMSIAIKTKRREPWWFITSYIANFVGGIIIQSILIIG